MKRNNNLLDKDVWDLIDSSQLSYKKNVEIGKSVSTATNKHSQEGSQHVPNETLALKNTPKP